MKLCSHLECVHVCCWAFFCIFLDTFAASKFAPNANLQNDKIYRGGVTRKLFILGQKSKSEFFKTYSLQAFFKMLTHRGKTIFLQKKGLYEACSIPHSKLSKVTLQIIFYFLDTLGHH